ncbi:MAG: roadblock/LC7 domain-containing protein [Candidatus Xenobia bacterium]
MSEELNKVLENFCRLDGVRGALVLNAQGDLVGTHAEKPIQQEVVSLLASRALQLGLDAAAHLQKDNVTHSYIELGDFSVVSEILDSRASLVIVIEPNANLGRLRLEIKKNRKVVEDLAAAP